MAAATTPLCCRFVVVVVFAIACALDSSGSLEALVGHTTPANFVNKHQQGVVAAGYWRWWWWWRWRWW